MKKYIYKITSPSKKIYIGQSTIPVENKILFYSRIEKYCKSKRKISTAIKKYKWENMVFEVIDFNDNWSKEELNSKEIFWISFYNSVNEGYNMTEGGDGVDSRCAKELALSHHRTMTEEKKEIRKQNCRKGQLKRFQNCPESEITKQRKSNSHKGSYRIESPEGKVWITDIGLKDFAELYKNEIKITYWQLFSAYRSCYNSKAVTRKRKDNNLWKVARLDKSSN